MHEETKLAYEKYITVSLHEALKSSQWEHIFILWDAHHITENVAG